MEKVDLVLVGAEGVVESGGIINKVRCFISCVYFFFSSYFNGISAAEFCFVLVTCFFNLFFLLLTFVGNIYSRLGQSADIQYSLAVWVGLGLFW